MFFISFSSSLHRSSLSLLCARSVRVQPFIVLLFDEMQEIYNKNKCQHIGEWKSNYMDKTMQIRTHIVFHSQLASHKNITVFRLENKACITHNKQTMKPGIDLQTNRVGGLECETKTTSSHSRKNNKSIPRKTETKHEPTHK